MDKEKIISEIERRSDLVGNKKVVAVYLFGSVASGKSGPLSDVDVCVIGSELGLRDKNEIFKDSLIGWDVSFFDELPIWIKMRVLKGVPVIVNDRDLLYDVGIETLHEYEDFKPTIAKMIERNFGWY